MKPKYLLFLWILFLLKPQSVVSSCTPETEATPVVFGVVEKEFMREQCLYDEMQACVLLAGACWFDSSTCTESERFVSELMFGAPVISQPSLALAEPVISAVDFSSAKVCLHSYPSPNQGGGLWRIEWYCTQWYLAQTLLRNRWCEHQNDGAACAWGAKLSYSMLIWFRGVQQLPPSIQDALFTVPEHLMNKAQRACENGDLNVCYEIAELDGLAGPTRRFGAGFMLNRKSAIEGYRKVCDAGHVLSCMKAGKQLRQVWKRATRREAGPLLKRSCEHGIGCVEMAQALKHDCSTCFETKPERMGVEQLKLTQESVALLKKACDTFGKREACTMFYSDCLDHTWRACPGEQTQLLTYQTRGVARYLTTD